MYIQTATGNDVGQALSKLSELLGVTSSSHPKPPVENKIRPLPLHQTLTETSNAIDLDKVLERARDRTNSPGKSAS